MSDNFAKVAKVQNFYDVVINKGKIDGVKSGEEYIIYKLGEEIFDPDTNVSLGHLEEIKGSMIVKHVQDRISILTSNDYDIEPDKTEIKKTKKGGPGTSLAAQIFGNDASEVTTIVPGKRSLKHLDNVEPGDLVKKRL